MNVLSSHAALWHNDRWYRRAWYIWPQTISLLLIGWLFVAPQTETTKPQPPWAKTQTPPKPQPPAQPAPPSPPQPAPQADEITCRWQNNPRDALNACNRLINAGQTGFYFHRAQIYFRNGDHDRAIADLSAFIQLNLNNVRALNDRGLSYEKKGEYDKALADFREALNKGSTTVSEDIKRVERAIESLRSKYVVNGLDGLNLGGRVSLQSNEYQDYQCTPSEQFGGVTWCNKQRVEKEARGSYRSSYTIAHSRDGIIDYLNRSLEPAFFNARGADSDIERLSPKFGGQVKRFSMALGPAPVDGLIAVWGKVTLESLDPTGVKELAAGRSPRQGILVDFIGNLTDSARRGLPIYRVTGGPGFVWAASFNPQGRGTLRFFAIDPSALLPGTAKESTAPAPTNSANPQGDCDRLAANPSDRGKPPSVPGVPYDSLMNQAKQAIEVCALAARQNPTELRYEYQMARAMEAEVPEKAVEIHKKLAGQKYPAA